MTEVEFIALAQKTFDAIENAIDQAGLDLDLDRQGNVLTLVFADDFEIVLNLQTPLKQVWLASLKGGHRYDWTDGAWREARTQETLSVTLTGLIKEKLGSVPEFFLDSLNG